MRGLTIAILLALVLVGPTARFAGAQPSTATVAIQVYNDGTVAVSQRLSVPANYTSIEIQLLSSVIADPVVVDENGSGLYFQVVGENMTIYTIGATGVTVSYDTASLTSKEGTVWTLSFQARYNSAVTLPEGSTLTDVSGVPTSMTTVGGAPVITIPPGTWQIEYGVPFELPVSSSAQSSSSVVSAGGGSSGASSVSLGSSYAGLNQSEASPAATARSSEGDAVLWAAGILLVLAGSGGYRLWRRRSTAFDAQNSELRPDDVKVIEFISEKGGKVLEPEIRMRFALPKTSGWRQIKRLEKLGYVRVTKIGSQNQVELVKGREGRPPTP